MFPGNSKTSIAGRWERIKNTSGQIKDKCVSLGGMANITRIAVLEFANFLADSMASLDVLTANAVADGLLDYARAQESDSGLDLVAEYNTMRTQIVATQDWMVANFPATSGELRVYAFDGNKRYGNINLTAGQLSAFKTQLTSLSNTIG